MTDLGWAGRADVPVWREGRQPPARWGSREVFLPGPARKYRGGSRSVCWSCGNPPSWCACHDGSGETGQLAGVSVALSPPASHTTNLRVTSSFLSDGHFTTALGLGQFGFNTFPCHCWELSISIWWWSVKTTQSTQYSTEIYALKSWTTFWRDIWYQNWYY